MIYLASLTLEAASTALHVCLVNFSTPAFTAVGYGYASTRPLTHDFMKQHSSDNKQLAEEEVVPG
jgi:hypothetical protein